MPPSDVGSITVTVPMPRQPSPTADVPRIRQHYGPTIDGRGAARAAVVRPQAALAAYRVAIDRAVRSPNKFLITIGAARLLSGVFLACATGERGAALVKDGFSKHPIAESVHALWLGAAIVLAQYGARDIQVGNQGLQDGHRGTALAKRFLSMSPVDNRVFLTVGVLVGAAGITGHTLLKESQGWWTTSDGMTLLGTLLTVQSLACLYRRHVLAQMARYRSQLHRGGHGQKKPERARAPEDG